MNLPWRDEEKKCHDVEVPFISRTDWCLDVLSDPSPKEVRVVKDVLSATLAQKICLSSTRASDAEQSWRSSAVGVGDRERSV